MIFYDSLRRIKNFFGFFLLRGRSVKEEGLVKRPHHTLGYQVVLGEVGVVSRGYVHVAFIRSLGLEMIEIEAEGGLLSFGLGGCCNFLLGSHLLNNFLNSGLFRFLLPEFPNAFVFIF